MKTKNASSTSRNVFHFSKALEDTLEEYQMYQLYYRESKSVYSFVQSLATFSF